MKLPGAFCIMLIFIYFQLIVKDFCLQHFSVFISLQFLSMCHKTFLEMETNDQIFKNSILILHQHYGPCPGFFSWRPEYQLDFSHKHTEFADCSLVSSEYFSHHKIILKLGMN